MTPDDHCTVSLPGYLPRLRRTDDISIYVTPGGRLSLRVLRPSRNRAEKFDVIFLFESPFFGDAMASCTSRFTSFLHKEGGASIPLRAFPRNKKDADKPLKIGITKHPIYGGDNLLFEGSASTGEPISASSIANSLSRICHISMWMNMNEGHGFLSPGIITEPVISILSAFTGQAAWMVYNTTPLVPQIMPPTEVEALVEKTRAKCIEFIALHCDYPKWLTLEMKTIYVCHEHFKNPPTSDLVGVSAYSGKQDPTCTTNHESEYSGIVHRFDPANGLGNCYDAVGKFINRMKTSCTNYCHRAQFVVSASGIGVVTAPVSDDTNIGHNFAAKSHDYLAHKLATLDLDNQL